MRDEETCHFWIETFPTEQRVSDYFAEVYDDNDENRDHTALSQFARDQNETYYNHHFMEYGFDKEATSINELVNGYSYHDQYEDEFTRRAGANHLQNLNMFVFISEDQLKHPKSAIATDYALHYVGTIKYRT